MFDLGMIGDILSKVNETLVVPIKYIPFFVQTKLLYDCILEMLVNTYLLIITQEVTSSNLEMIVMFVKTTKWEQRGVADKGREWLRIRKMDGAEREQLKNGAAKSS